MKNKKILFFIESLRGGGGERVASVLSQELSCRGHNVTIATNALICDYDISPKVRLINLYKGIDRRTSNNQISRFFLYLTRFLNLLKNVRYIIKKEKPDIVVSFMGCASIQLLIMCYRRVPLIFSEHTTFDRVDISRELKLTRNIIEEYADAVTILTKYDERYLGKKIPSKVVLPNPLSFDPMSVNEFKTSFDKRKNILACGTLYPLKGFDSLIKAFSLIAKDYPSWNLQIAGGVGEGNTEYTSYLKQIIKKEKLEDRVELLGFKKNIKELMITHSIFAMPSKLEGFSMVLIEAMACGCACISYDCVCGPREIITDKVDGLLVQNQNVEDLAKKMNMLIRSPQFRMELGYNAINNVKRFNKDPIVDKWEVLFSNVLKRYNKN